LSGLQPFLLWNRTVNLASPSLHRSCFLNETRLPR
jgi:hypothetical protein